MYEIGGEFLNQTSVLMHFLNLMTKGSIILPANARGRADQSPMVACIHFVTSLGQIFRNNVKKSHKFRGKCTPFLHIGSLQLSYAAP